MLLVPSSRGEPSALKVGNRWFIVDRRRCPDDRDFTCAVPWHLINESVECTGPTLRQEMRWERAGMATSEVELRELMAGQLKIWYAQQLAPDNRSFSVADCLEVRGPVDVGLLVRAARLRLAELETFRLRIRLVGGVPMQYVHDA